MAFHGNESQDRYKWYQSPHLGLIPGGYGDGISGGYYSYYPVYPLCTQMGIWICTQPNPYPPPHHLQLVQPDPTHHSPQPNTNLWINPPVSPISAPPLTSYQQQPSSTTDVKQGEPDLHLGSISREPDRVHDSGYSSFTPEPKHRPKESGNLLAPNGVSGELSFKGQIGKLGEMGESLKKSMDTFMSEFREELRLLRESRKLQASHVESAPKRFEPPPQASTLELAPATTESSSPAILPSTAESVRAAANTGLNLSQHEVIYGFNNGTGTEVVASAVSKVSPHETLDLSNHNDVIVVSGSKCEDGISIGISDNLNQVINRMDASVENRESEFQVTEGMDNVIWKNDSQSHFKHCSLVDGSYVGGTLLGSEAHTYTDVGEKLGDDKSTDVIDSNKMGANSRGKDFGIYDTKLPAVTINSIGNLHEVREVHEMEIVGAKNDEMTLKFVEDDDGDPPDKEHSEGNDGSENDVNQPVFTGNFQVLQLNGLSGDTVVYSNVHDLEANLEFAICSKKSSLVSEDMDSKEAVKIIKEHIMSCTGPPDECQLDDHRYEQLSFVTVEKELFLQVEMVHEKIWEKRKSIHVGLASEGNAKELDSIAMEGLKLDSEMKMCFIDKLSEAKFWQWFILVTKMPVIFHRAAFDKVGDPFSQSQVFITVTLNSGAWVSFLFDLINFYAMFCGAFNVGNVLSDDTFGMWLRKAKLVDDYITVGAKMLTRRANKELVSSNASMINIIITALCGKSICSFEQHVKMQDVRLPFLSLLLMSIHTLIKREATSIIRSLPYHIDHQVERWIILHVMMYEEELLLVLFGKLGIMKVEALRDTSLRTDEAANKQTPQFLAFNMCTVHSGMGQTGRADALCSPDTVISKGVWERNIVSWSAMFAGLEFNHNTVDAFLYACVKGACGVGMSFSGKYIIWAFAADDSKIETNLDMVSKDENKSAEGVWGIVGVVLCLTNSIGAMYNAGVRDVSLRCQAAQLQFQRHFCGYLSKLVASTLSSLESTAQFHDVYIIPFLTCRAEGEFLVTNLLLDQMERKMNLMVVHASSLEKDGSGCMRIGELGLSCRSLSLSDDQFQAFASSSLDKGNRLGWSITSLQRVTMLWTMVLTAFGQPQFSIGNDGVAPRYGSKDYYRFHGTDQLAILGEQAGEQAFMITSNEKLACKCVSELQKCWFDGLKGYDIFYTAALKVSLLLMLVVGYEDTIVVLVTSLTYELEEKLQDSVIDAHYADET